MKCRNKIMKCSSRAPADSLCLKQYIKDNQYVAIDTHLSIKYRSKEPGYSICFITNVKES